MQRKQADKFGDSHSPVTLRYFSLIAVAEYSQIGDRDKIET